MPILRTLLCAALAAPLLLAQDRRACVEACMRAWSEDTQACTTRYSPRSPEYARCFQEALRRKNQCLVDCPETRAAFAPTLEDLLREPLPFRTLAPGGFWPLPGGVTGPFPPAR